MSLVAHFAAVVLLYLLVGVRADNENPDKPRPDPPAEGRIFFFAIASRQYGWYCDMLRSAGHNGITMHIFGFHDKRLNKHTKVMKIQLILDALHRIPNNTIAVMVDAFDVLFARDEEAILQAYRNLNTDVVIGCEKMCYNEMLPDCSVQFPTWPSGYGGLNSGAMIGSAQGLIDLYRRAAQFRDHNPKHNKNQKMATDQGFVGQAFLALQKEGRNISLDCNETMIQNMWSANEDYCNRSQLVNCKTGTQPSIFHFNGGRMKEKPIANWSRRFWWAQEPTNETALIWLDGAYLNISQVCRRNNGEFVRWWK